MEYTKKVMATVNGKEQRISVTFNDPNSKGETVEIEFVRCYGGTGTVSDKWFKSGHIKENLKEWWGVEVFVTNQKDIQSNYSPVIRIEREQMYDSVYDYVTGMFNKKQIGTYERRTINFDWILEATQENMEKIIAEVYKRAF